MDDSLSPDDKAFFDAVIAAGPAGLAVSAGRVVARDDGAYDLILDPDVLFAGTVGGFLDAMGAPDVDGGDLGNYGADSPAGRDVFPVHTRNGKADGPWDYGMTHDMDCPGCKDTPFTASPRSETYWSS